MNTNPPPWFDIERQSSIISEKKALSFLPIPWPTKKDERWKYADLHFLKHCEFVLSKKNTAFSAETIHLINRYHLNYKEHIFIIFINGFFIPALSDLDRLPPFIHVNHLKDVDNKNTLSFYREAIPHAFAYLNEAVWQDGLFLALTANHHLTQPIHLLCISTMQTEASIAHIRHIIEVEENASMTLIEEHLSHDELHYMNNISTMISLKPFAKLDYCKIQKEASQSVHIAHTTVSQAKETELNCTYFSKGSRFARQDLIVELKESGAVATLNGLYFTENNAQYVDQQIEVIHHAAHTESKMLYKGILNQQSRGVFNGKLLVKANAEKIKALQANHNLLLSQQAEIYSKPLLLVYADDVKCQHGATVGQLDLESLFYLTSRGVIKEDAVTLLLQGFMAEVLSDISSQTIKKLINTEIGGEASA